MLWDAGKEYRSRVNSAGLELRIVSKWMRLKVGERNWLNLPA